MANDTANSQYRTASMRITLQFHSLPDQMLHAETFTPLLMEHFKRWGLEAHGHAGSYSPLKESKTEICFVHGLFGLTKTKQLSMTLIIVS